MKLDGIPPALRFRVLHRDRFTCRYCGQRPPAVVLHVDHVIPTVRGGLTIYQNLVTACGPCNLGKGAMDLDGPPAPGLDPYRNAVLQCVNDLADGDNEDPPVVVRAVTVCRGCGISTGHHLALVQTDPTWTTYVQAIPLPPAMKGPIA